MDYIELAKQISTLGVAGVLGYIYLQWQSGKIHSDSELQEIRDGFNEERRQMREDADKDREYREGLRVEVTRDRRASDERVDALTQVMKESNELTKRLLDFNERLVEDVVHRKPTRRGGGQTP